MPKESSFEEELQALEEIVLSLEKGDIPLDEAMKIFEKGMKLSKNLTLALNSAEEKIAKIMKDSGEEPFEEQADGLI